ncbi:MAG: tagatose 1,6-diphosphate aldolase [Chloroflexi bacterium]|nr:tagatose 1,6-diphosphate aldolase [Chloroflexota bacterium]
MTTIGKYRRLTRCSDARGLFHILACDHRGNLRGRLTQRGRPIDDEGFVRFKQQLLQSLLHDATAVLADPQFGFGPAFAERIIPGHVGTLSPLEVTDYDAPPAEQGFTEIPGWNIAKCLRAGVDGVKLLLPYHPRAENAGAKREWVSHIVAQCALWDVPFFLEPIVHSRVANEPLSHSELIQAMVAMVVEFAGIGVDVLKLQFPVDVSHNHDEAFWSTACRELDAACTIPWTLLSAGVDYPTFARQARVACAAGASGVIVGRAVWAEAVNLAERERAAFLQEVGRQRMAELATIVRSGRPWWEKIQPIGARGEWYRDY